MEKHNLKNNLPQDRDSFETVFKELYSSLCAYAYNFVREQEASEEIVQEIFFKMWNQRREIQISSSLDAYLYRSVRNASLNLLKHINIRERYKESNSENIRLSEREEVNPLEASELEKIIRKSIDMLPEQRKRIFIMSRYEELKYREIAEKLNISVKTVENQMGKALSFLRKELADYITIILLLFSQHDKF